MKFTSLPSGRRLAIWGALFALTCWGAPRLARENYFGEGGRLESPLALPEFPLADPINPLTTRWIGTEPLTLEQMLGRVWVLKVWTFGCVNCQRSIPFFNGLKDRFGGQVGLLGIHSPEFDWERDIPKLEASMQEHQVRFPSYIDENLDYFFALGATAWPTFLVVDREGFIRGRWVGEVHDGTTRARKMELLINELLAEQPRQ